MRILFVNAHPDDVEFTCASTCKQAIDLGWDVWQVLMTTDEYGTSRNDFKGKRIRAIRKHEMEDAAKVYGVKEDGSSKLNLIWFGDIDANLRFNRLVFKRLKELIITIHPDVIFAPDGFFTLDEHPDHKRTGWLVHLIIKSLKPSARPLLLLYHSTKTNFYIPIKHLKIQISAWEKHRSQATPFFNKIIFPLRKVFYTFKKIKSGPKKCEGFRKIYFIENENTIKKLRHKILYYLIANTFSGFSEKLCIPSPIELGLNPKEI